MSTATAALAGLVLAVATGLAGYGYGIDQGKALEKGRQDASALKTLTDQVNAHADLVKRSGAASRHAQPRRRPRPGCRGRCQRNTPAVARRHPKPRR